MIVYAIRQNGHIAVRAPFMLKETCKSVPGARWNKNEKCWMYPATHATALALVAAFHRVHDLRMDESTRDLLLEAHEAQKARALKDADGLAPIPGDAEHPEFESWTHQRQAYHWAKAQQSAMLAMDMGCLHGDSIVHVTRSTAGMRMTMRELHRRWQESWAHLDTPVYVRGEAEHGDLRPVRLTATQLTGVRPTVVVTLSDGRQLRCTPDHEIQTPDGKREAAAMEPGDLVAVQLTGDYVDQRRRAGRRNRFRFGYLPIVSIEPAEDAEVFDLTVDADPHTYVADGFVVSNTGKSKTAIALLEGWDAEAVLILAPRNVLRVWPKQFRLHGVREWEVIVPPAKATVQARAAFITKAAEVARAKGTPFAVVVNYEAAWRAPLNFQLQFGLPMVMPDKKWDVVVCDESHRIKAPGGKASQFASSLTALSKRRLTLTGTPMPHSPLDIYAQFRFLDPGVFGSSFARFRNIYAQMGGFEGRQVLGYTNRADLDHKIGAMSYICKAEDVQQLPDSVHTERIFDLDPATRRAYNKLRDEFLLWLSEDESVTAANALTKLLRLQQMTSGYLNDDAGNQHRIGDEKYQLLCDVMEDAAPNEREPVVVICKFQHDLDRVREMCEAQGRRFGEISGRTRPGRDDWGLTEDSTMREDIDVVAVQIQAGGVGIDLTRAAIAIYYSVGFSLGDFLQVGKRYHRPGQTRHTTSIHLIAANTVDEKVYAALSERKSVVETVLSSAKTLGLD